MDNLMISGKWINKKTGEVVVVQNNVIDGDTMILVTDTGTITMDEFNDFIQVTDESMINDISSNINNSISENNYQQYVMDDDFSAINNHSNNHYNGHSNNNSSSKQNNQQRKDENIIGKIFNKIPNYDKLLNITFNTDILPIDNLKIMIEYLDITTDDMADYIIKKILDKTYLASIIKKELDNIFDNDNTVYSEIEEIQINETQINEDEN